MHIGNCKTAVEVYAMGRHLYDDVGQRVIVCTGSSAVRKEENMAEYKPTALQTSKRYLTATDVAELLGVSRSTAYRIIKRLNSELEKAGKLTVAGKVSAKYFYENTYL